MLPTTSYELDLLTRAHQYQKWVSDTVRPYVGNRILEVGSGIGNLSQWLPLRERLLLSEADERFIPRLREVVRETFGEDDSRVSVLKADLTTDWAAPLLSENLDTVISFNVMEHIEDDLQAMREFARILRGSSAQGPKRIVSFVPAHAWAYGAMDRKFGHFRRYSAGRFKGLARELGGVQAQGRYFNAVGVPGWVVMGRVLGRDKIGEGAVTAFERLCPWVRGVDDFVHEKLRLPIGQSYLSILTLDP